MQRQSLGSPVSKLHIQGGLPKEDSRDVAEADDENKTTKPSRRLSLSSPPSSSSSSFSSIHSNPEKLIHLIPLLTIVCFLILYLSSHSPSQSDLEHFNALNRPANHIHSTSEIENVGRLIELRRGDVFAIRTLRNLREEEKHTPKSRPPRKIANF